MSRPIVLKASDAGKTIMEVIGRKGKKVGEYADSEDKPIKKSFWQVKPEQVETYQVIRE